jgi:hypothetical protein
MADGGDCLWDEDGRSTPLCFAITHGLMFTSMSGITEDNASEFYARIHLVEKLTGPFRIGPVDDNGEQSEVFITPDEVKQCIGLTVNVAQESRTKFMNGFVKNNIEGWKSDYKRNLS